MNIKINGKVEAIKTTSLTVAELLRIAKVGNPEMVSVQLNGEFVSKENFDTTRLKHEDAVDFMYFMGGGARGRSVPGRELL